MIFLLRLPQCPQWIGQGSPIRFFPDSLLHNCQETGFIRNEIKTAAEHWGSVPAVNLLVRKSEIDELLISAEKLAETGVKAFSAYTFETGGKGPRFQLCSHSGPRRNCDNWYGCFRSPVSNSVPAAVWKIRKILFWDAGQATGLYAIDERQRIKSCSFNKTGISLSNFDYREVLDALPFLNRLDCHSRIRLSETSAAPSCP